MENYGAEWVNRTLSGIKKSGPRPGFLIDQINFTISLF